MRNHARSHYSNTTSLEVVVGRSSTLMLLLLGSAVKAEKIACPILQCSDPLLDGPIDYDLCWKVEDNQPMTIMKSHDCVWYIGNEKSNLEVDVISTCDFTAHEDGGFAWVDELTQGITADDTERATMLNS